MKVCRVDMCLHLLVGFRSRCGRGEIVRLKPDLLLRASASVHERGLVRNVTNEPRRAQVAGDA